MKQLHRTKLTHLCLSIAFLCIFAACSTGGTSQPAAVTTATPTQVFTPEPTPPEVPSKAVRFKTSDNIELAGLLYGQGKTIVICSHEYRTTKAIWSPTGIVYRLVTRGYQVLAYDFRGNGDSGGQNDISKMDVDLHAAIAFARQQGATKIVLMGSSMGGTATLKAASSEPVAAIITLSAPQDFGVTVKDADLQAMKFPKLFVNSENDDYAPDTMHMYTVSSEPKEIKMYPGRVHGTSNFGPGSTDDLTVRILNFVTRYVPAS